MVRKYITIISLVAFFIITGCTSSRLLLKKGKGDLRLKPEEGAIVFSLETTGVSFRPDFAIIQEINQYKEFKEKRLEQIPRPKDSPKGVKNIHYFNLKFPQGTYIVTSFYGFLGGFWTGRLQNVPCNKLFDITPGTISYGGRLKSRLSLQGRSCMNDVVVEDFYEKDVKFLRDRYLMLQGRKIKKDFMY